MSLECINSANCPVSETHILSETYINVVVAKGSKLILLPATNPKAFALQIVRVTRGNVCKFAI